MKIPPPSIALIGTALAFLTVKDLQSLADIRLVSLAIPTLLAVFYAGRLRELVVPRTVLAYIALSCVVLPLVSIVNKGAFSVYEFYLIMTVLCGYFLVAMPYSLLQKDMEWLGNMYVGAIVVMCVLSYATFREQWFGSYTIRSFSDFSTFFALQASIAVPFLHGRHRNLLRIFVLITLFLTYSRLSFFLSIFVVIFQTFKENKARFILLIPVFSAVFLTFLLTTTAGNLMLSKMSKLVNIGSGNFAQESPDPSDLGRIAYLVTTIQHLDSARVIAVGHGIKTNHVIIGKDLDTHAWGLLPSMADATVHNVYLELISDTGLLGLVPFVLCLLYVGRTIARYHGMQSNYFISYAIFVLSYVFEANYVSFFFQYTVMFFLFVAHEARQRAVPRSRTRFGPVRLLRWFAAAHIHHPAPSLPGAP